MPEEARAEIARISRRAGPGPRPGRHRLFLEVSTRSHTHSGHVRSGLMQASRARVGGTVYTGWLRVKDGKSFLVPTLKFL